MSTVYSKGVDLFIRDALYSGSEIIKQSLAKRMR